ncbi:MAG: hypothetical protein K0M78_02085 [Brevundimonas sp.]|nr:hypothetical protein [Brevundimonas sp.]
MLIQPERDHTQGDPVQTAQEEERVDFSQKTTHLADHNPRQTDMSPIRLT